MSYSKLFEKGRIGKLELKNRIVMTPMGTGFANSNGEASNEIIKYYQERAKGGVGLIITEITRVDEVTGIGMNWQLGATHGRHIQGLIRLAEAVHAHDTKIFLQLHHPGNETPSRLLGGKQAWSASEVTCKTIGERPHAMTTEEVEAMEKKFVTAAVIAKTAGIDGIELHAAHGYLLNQFISPHNNTRTDKYGGNFFNRMRMITNIIKTIQFTCGPDFPISVRINGDDFYEEGNNKDECIHVARYLENLGIACLNVSCGTYESGATIIEPSFYQEGWKKHLAADIKKNTRIPIIAVNTIKHPAFAEQLLEEGVSDFVGVARCNLTDPQWGNKAKAGKDDMIRKCIGCMECFRVANMGRPIECTVNPILGREYTWGDEKLVKDGDGKAMAVIGGGPSGMQAAAVLAKRGYKVTLFEKSGALGGSMNLADKPPHKELITELITAMELEIKELGVDIKLNTEATVDAIKALKPAGVFVAMGGHPILPPMPGIEKAVTAEDVLTGKVKLSGKNVAVIGGGVTGLETGEFLCKDNSVTVIEMLAAVGTTLYPTVIGGIKKRYEENGAKIMTGHSLAAIGDGELTLINMTSGYTVPMKADTVVMALGVRPNRDLVEALEKEFDRVVCVGDTVRGGTIKDALHSAYDKAFVF